MNATDAQITFIGTLLDEKAVEDQDRAIIEFEVDGGSLSKKGASTWITFLLARPKAKAQQELAIEVPVRERATEVGFYKTETGDVYKIVDAAYSSRRYAKLTTPHGLMYREGAMSLLFADMKMTGEEIAAHGVANCYCVNCSTDLTDPISKQVGLGTSCGPNILGKDGYKAARKAALEIPEVKAAHKAHQAALKADREAYKAAQAAKTDQLTLV